MEKKGPFMKTRKIALAVMLFALIPVNSHAAPPSSQDLKKIIDTVHFRHAWKVQPFFDSWEFISPFKAPASVSAKGEEEAAMYVGTSSDNLEPSIEKALPGQIKKVQDEFRVIESLPSKKAAHKPVNNIVSYTEKVGDKEIGVLEYRIAGEKNDPPGPPRSLNQVFFLKGGQLYNVTLAVLFAGHEEEVRADQMELVKALLK